ncbi:MAG: hypothetical protein ACRCSN_10770 [Dermatophilaceae bacterium]
MKVLAVSTILTTDPAVLAKSQDPEIRREEAGALWRLYVDGVIEQQWWRSDQPGPVFVLEVASVDDAAAALAEFPLAKAGLLGFDLIPMGPNGYLESLWSGA